MTEVQEKPTTQETDPGDHELFSHYVLKSDWEKGYLEGKPIRAICGKLWKPTKDAEKFPLCPDCDYLSKHKLDGSSRD